MKRRHFILGSGAAAGGSVLLGSGAFSRIESHRDVTVEVAEDRDAYLKLAEAPSRNSDNYVEIDERGHLGIDISENPNGGEGLNSNSTTYFDDLFRVCNQGTQDVAFYVREPDSDDFPDGVSAVNDEGDPRLQFYIGTAANDGDDGIQSLTGAENAVTLPLGECLEVGLRANTKGVDATDDQPLFGEELTLVADTGLVREPEEEPPDEPVENRDTGETYDRLVQALDEANEDETLVAAANTTFSPDQRLVIDTQGLTVRGSGGPLPTITTGIDIEPYADGVTLDQLALTPDDTEDGVTAQAETNLELVRTVIEGANVGVRVTDVTDDTLENVVIGKQSTDDVTSNRFIENDVGVRIETPTGEIRESASTIGILARNGFTENEISIEPRPGTSADLRPTVSPEAGGIDIQAPEQPAGTTTTAKTDIELDDGQVLLSAFSVSVDSDTEVDLGIQPSADSPDQSLPPGYDSTSFFEIDVTQPDNAAVERVVFTVTVERNRIESPDDFSLLRFDADEEEWTPIPTSHTGTTAERHHYRVRSPGLSIFGTAEVDVTVDQEGAEQSVFTLHPNLPTTSELRLENGTIDDVDVVDEDPQFAVVGTENDLVELDFSTLDVTGTEETIESVFSLTNTGDETVHARLFCPDDVLAFEVDFDGLPFASRDLARPTPIPPGESLPVDAVVQPGEPDQIRAQFLVPTIADQRTGELVDGSDEAATITREDLNNRLFREQIAPVIDRSGLFSDPEQLDPNCLNETAAPVMWMSDYAAPGEDPDWVPDGAIDARPYLRVPALVRIEQVGDVTEDLSLEIPFVNGEAGAELVSLYDPDESEYPFPADDVNPDREHISVFDQGEGFTDLIPGEELANGAVVRRFDLIFQTANNCPLDLPGASTSFELNGLELKISFIEDESEWAEIAGTDEIVEANDYYTTGTSSVEEIQAVVDEAFEIFRDGVIDAVAPAPVAGIRSAKRAARAGPRDRTVPNKLEIANEVSGLLTDEPLTPDEILQEGIVGGIVQFGRSGGERSLDGMDLPDWFNNLINSEAEVVGAGPVVTVSRDPIEPRPVDPNVRTLTVEGQQAGGPIVLMGLDSEQSPSSSNHGPPEDHADMVESILDSVTNGGDGILVLGSGDDGDDVVEYWRNDVGSRVGEEVTFVEGADDIRDQSFDGFAMIGIPSSDNQVSGGDALVSSENQALIDRRGDIATFVNEGGGLLGKTQEGFADDDSWEYISPIADLTAIDSSYSSIGLTDDGAELGLTQGGMDGWCCYHEYFEPESVPDFLDPLLLANDNEDEIAAIGGAEVVVETAVQLEITGPANVEVSETTDFEFALESLIDESEAEDASEDVVFEIEISSRDAIGSDEVALTDSGETVSLNAEDGTLTGTFPEEPIELTPGFEQDRTVSLTFDEATVYDVQVDVRSADAGETLARIPFEIRCVPESPGVSGI